MKKTKQNLYAEWEVISMAEWLEGLGRNPTNDELIATYKGNFFPLYLNRQGIRNRSGHSRFKPRYKVMMVLLMSMKWSGPLISR